MPTATVTRPSPTLDPSHPSRTTEEHLDEALERVFRKYGSDVSAFLKDVTDEMSSKQQVKIDQKAARLHR